MVVRLYAVAQVLLPEISDGGQAVRMFRVGWLELALAVNARVLVRMQLLHVDLLIRVPVVRAITRITAV